MNLLRTASTVSLLTLASRVTGLVRETLVAAAFGATAWADAYQVAFRIPNLLRRLFAEGAFSAAFVPMFAGELQGEGRDAALAFARQAHACLLMMFVFQPFVPFSASVSRPAAS